MKTSLILAAIAATLALPAFAEGDAAKGEKVFNKCKACHAVGDGAKNKVGPQLNGIVGAAAGQNADYKYSDALLAAAAEGLTDRTKMAFPGLRKEDEIANVIAYLATFE